MLPHLTLALFDPSDLSSDPLQCPDPQVGNLVWLPCRHQSSLLAASESEDDVIQSRNIQTGTVWALFWLCKPFFNGLRVQRSAGWARPGPALPVCEPDCHAKPAEQRRQWSVENKLHVPVVRVRRADTDRSVWSWYRARGRTGGQFLLRGAAMTSPPGSRGRDGDQNQQQMWQFPFEQSTEVFKVLHWVTPWRNVTKDIYSTGLQDKLRNLLHSTLHFLLHYTSPAAVGTFADQHFTLNKRSSCKICRIITVKSRWNTVKCSPPQPATLTCDLKEHKTF